MLGRIFLIFELLLKITRLWDEFGEYVEVRRKIEDEAKRKRRNDAIDRSKKAENESDIWESQEDIVSNRP